jgi:hypothetical protein
MYIKWIVCDVKKSLEKDFSLAQEKWIGIQSTEGLIGQLGGWDLKHANVACVEVLPNFRTAVLLF